MLIRHAAYFQLLPVLDHPVSVILTTLVAALVPIVGLALSAPATRRLLAVRLPAITVVADDERPATPPTFDLSSLCAHRLTRGERRKFGRSNEPCDLSSRIARLKGPAPNPGPSSFCRSPRSALPGRRAQTPIPGGAVRSCPGPGDSGETGTQRERWRHSGSVPPLRRYHDALRLPVSPISLTCARSMVPACCSGEDGTSLVPRRPSPYVPRSTTPAEPLEQASGTASLRFAPDGVAFRACRLVGFRNVFLSGSNSAAHMLAVYASQPESPLHHARLASGWWPYLGRAGF